MANRHFSTSNTLFCFCSSASRQRRSCDRCLVLSVGSFGASPRSFVGKGHGQSPHQSYYVPRIDHESAASTLTALEKQPLVKFPPPCEQPPHLIMDNRSGNQSRNAWIQETKNSKGVVFTPHSTRCIGGGYQMC